MRINFWQCREGQAAVDERLADGSLINILHISSPINQNPNRIRTCRILTENNPEMKARLPGLAFSVVSSVIDVNRARSSIRGVPVEDMNVHGTFSDAATATASAEHFAWTVAGGDGSNVQAYPPGTAGAVSTFVVRRQGNSEITTVQVRRDEGQTTVP